MMNKPASKESGWVRFAQIVLGIIAIVASIIVIAYPGISTISLVYFLSLLFFIVGIETIIVGIFFKTKSRLATIGLGILVLILSGLALAFPVGTTYLLIMIVGFALLFDGIARIIYGIFEKSENKSNRFFSIIVGVISMVISTYIIGSPLFGFTFVGFLIGISILITGIQILVAGIRGQRTKLSA